MHLHHKTNKSSTLNAVDSGPGSSPFVLVPQGLRSNAQDLQ